MLEVGHSVLAFIVVLGVLITFHEFGHFWVARRCDVKILRFSIGFGRPLWKRHYGKDRFEFVIASLPLGGYVKMLDEREGPVAEHERQRAFNNKSLTQRTMIVAAGPVFNFVFAIFAYWIMYLVGIDDIKPVVGEVEENSIAEQSGFESGDRIISVDGDRTPTWSTVIDTTVANVVKASEINVRVLRDGAGEQDIAVDLSRISIDEMASGKLFKAIGLFPARVTVPAVIGEVIAGGAAEASGLMAGDEIRAVDGVVVKDWIHWVQLIREHPDKKMKIELSRKQKRLVLPLTPRAVVEGNETVGKIGAAVDQSYLDDDSYLAVESYSLLPALGKAVQKTFEMSALTLRILGKMLVGEASVRNLSGPVSIAQYAGKTANIGLVAFLGFMAIISVSLGVLNLLPVPILDGGHLLYFFIEMIKGSPPTESFQIAGQQLGLVLLFGLMSIALYNDIVRLIG